MANKKAFPFKIGADPEFIILAGDKYLRANEAIEKFLTKVKGLKLVHGNQGYNIGDHGNIGWDGAAMIGELRPTPEHTPGAVVEHIGALMAAASKAMPFADFSPLSFVNPVGGHIHLEVPENITPETAKRRAKMVCSLAAPLLASEHPSSSKYRRDKGNYGELGDVRVDAHFTRTSPEGRTSHGYTAEIRFLTAEWLITPKIAESTMALLAVIWDGVLNSDEFRKEAKALSFANASESLAITTMLSSTYGEVGQFITNRIKRLVRTAPMYPQYKEMVDYAMDAKHILADKEKAEWLINVGWKFSETTNKPTKKEFLSEKVVKERIAGKDDETLENYWPVSYNDDLNVSLFAEALNERVAAFGWKPNREYYLFGLRKEVPGLIARDSKGYFAGAEYATAMADTLVKMETRAQQIALKNGKKLDVRNGKHRQTQDPVIIGIPRSMRTNKETKDFLSLVIDIDLGKAKQSDAIVGKGAVQLEKPPEVIGQKIEAHTMTELVNDIEVIEDQLAETKRTAERPTIQRAHIRNLVHWMGRDGDFSVRRASQAGQYRTQWDRQFPEYTAENDDILVFYGGTTASVVNLGNEEEEALEIIGRLFGYPVNTLQETLVQNRQIDFVNGLNHGAREGNMLGINATVARNRIINSLIAR